MSGLPRLAIGSVSPETDYRPAVWAALDALDRQGVRIQSFLPRACLAEVDAASVITGIAPRHLDSWLMSRDFCRHTFLRIARQSDLAIVEGDLSPLPAAQPGGQLQALCDWLALPRLGVWHVRGLADHHLPTRRPVVDALILDGITSSHQLYHLQTTIETLWGIPVLGALEELPLLRQAIRQLSPGEKPSRELCDSLGDNLLRSVHPAALLELAQRRNLVSFECDGFVPLASPLPAGEPIEPSEKIRKLVRGRRGLSGDRGESQLTVAVAYDEVFHGYFPDTLDALEQLGTTVRDFSRCTTKHSRPTVISSTSAAESRSCGPANWRQNHCLHAALREHVCSGRRIYAEGGGMAFLCQHLVLPDGRRAAMAGVLPATAYASTAPATVPDRTDAQRQSLARPRRATPARLSQRKLAVRAERSAFELCHRAAAPLRSGRASSGDRQSGTLRLGRATGAVGEFLAAVSRRSRLGRGPLSGTCRHDRARRPVYTSSGERPK